MDDFMNPYEESLRYRTRRQFFRDCGVGLGSVALASLLNQNLLAATANSPNPLAPHAPHFPPKIKRIIYLFMAGAPSQLDLFDRKPVLQQHNGEPIPPEFVKGERFAF